VVGVTFRERWGLEVEFSEILLLYRAGCYAFELFEVEVEHPNSAVGGCCI
jgi:hypothetical protein